MLSPEAADSISEDSFEVPVEEHVRPRPQEGLAWCCPGLPRQREEVATFLRAELTRSSLLSASSRPPLAAAWRWQLGGAAWCGL
ncbi:hypothetical protein Anapl_04903 [Anas platyrhynchos]|uniref:Uncharacterized protein n=1 Tax=Anas platyrhynchos TaxID=8839 RepID=R0LQM6_ANAPL|nr:hypothetical protein Anapl_04903 [Anas platyrhynchos]